MKKQNKIFLKHCISFGSLIGLSLILISFLFYKNGNAININPQLVNANYMLAICGIFIGVKKLRNDFMQGYISYGQALKAGITIMAFAAILFAIYSYIIYSIDADLIGNFIVRMEESMQAANWTEETINAYINIYRSFITPTMIAFIEVINKIFMGTLFSLFLASILSNKKNLNIIDKTSNLDENKKMN